MMSAKNKLIKAKQDQSSILLAIAGFVLVALAIGAFIYIPKAQAEVQTASAQGGLVPIQLDQAAVDVSLTDLDGNPVKFSDYKGQVILYNAWATWCPPCKEEMPVLEQYYKDHKNDGFVVLAVEDGEPVSEVAAYVKAAGLTFPVWPDLKWIASETYGINNLPTTVVIDRNFRVRLTWTGAVSRATLDEYVTPLLSE
jgi:peroxiredoxin